MMPDLRPDKSNPTGGDSRTIYTIGVVVPLAIALATGLFVGLATAYIFYQFGSQYPVDWGFGAGVVTIPFTWIWLVKEKMIPVIERMFGVDLNGDGIQGPAPALPAADPPLTVYLRASDGQNTAIARLPIPSSLRADFARGMLAGRTSYRYWIERGISQVAYSRIIEEMVERGIAQRASGKGQIALTAAGRQMFQQYLGQDDGDVLDQEPGLRAYAHEVRPPTLRRRRL